MSRGLGDVYKRQGYDGTHNWSRDYGAAPQAVINARETLVFISGTVEVLNAPHE